MRIKKEKAPAETTKKLQELDTRNSDQSESDGVNIVDALDLAKAEISIYSGARDRVSKKLISVQHYLEDIRDGRYKREVEAVRSAESKAEKSELKKKLPAVTVSGAFKSRKAEALLQHSGILAIDIDLEGNEEAIAAGALDQVKRDPCFFAVHKSAGGQGLALYALIYPDNHLGCFKAVENYLDISYELKADPTCKDVVRLRFVSYDPELILRSTEGMKVWEPLEEAELASAVATDHQIQTRADIGMEPAEIMDKVCDVAAYIMDNEELQQEYFKDSSTYEAWRNRIAYSLGHIAHGYPEISEEMEKVYNNLNKLYAGSSEGIPFKDWILPAKDGDLGKSITGFLSLKPVEDRPIQMVSDMVKVGKVKKSRQQQALDAYIDALDQHGLYYNYDKMGFEKNGVQVNYKYFDNIMVDLLKSRNIPINEKLFKACLSTLPERRMLREWMEFNSVSYKKGELQKLADTLIFESGTDTAHVSALKAMFIKSIVGAVKAVMEDEYSNILMPVFVGSKKAGKTLLVRYMCMASTLNKDDFLSQYLYEGNPMDVTIDRLQDQIFCCNFMINIDDADFLYQGGKSDAKMRAKLSQHYFNIHVVNRQEGEPRRKLASVFASTNRSGVVWDPQNNRRVIPMPVHKVNGNPSYPVDPKLPKLQDVDMRAVYAEALHLLNSGFKEDIEAEQNILDEISSEYSTAENPLMPFIKQYMEFDKSYKVLTVQEILAEMSAYKHLIGLLRGLTSTQMSIDQLLRCAENLGKKDRTKRPDPAQKGKRINVRGMRVMFNARYAKDTQQVGEKPDIILP